MRPRQNPADFLRDWGATTVQADLGDPTSLPATLVGIHTVIDCATARPEEPSAKIDWVGKKSLIQCAQVCATRSRTVGLQLDHNTSGPCKLCVGISACMPGCLCRQRDIMQLLAPSRHVKACVLLWLHASEQANIAQG